MTGVRRVGLLAFFVTFLTAATLLAGPNGSPTERDWLRPAAHPTTPGSTSAGPSLGKWLAGGLLVGLSGLALWKRRRTSRPKSNAPPSQIQITGVARLSSRAQLMVATVNGKSMLLGVTDANITRLMWLESPNGEGKGGRRAPESSRAASEDPASLDLYPNQLSRQARLAAVRHRAAAARPSALATPSPSPTAKPRQTSRFREILADAIGLEPKVSPVSPLAKAPVDELTAHTEDRFIATNTIRLPTAQQTQRMNAASSLIDVEGQAAGLVARLNRPPS